MLPSILPIFPWSSIRSHFPDKQNGHDTPSIVESVNAHFLGDRELPILQMLDSTWHNETEERFSRYENYRSEAALHPAATTREAKPSNAR